MSSPVAPCHAPPYHDDDIEIVGPDLQRDLSSGFDMVGSTANASQQQEVLHLESVQHLESVLYLEGDDDLFDHREVAPPPRKRNRTTENPYLEEYEEQQQQKKQAERAARDAKIHAMLYENPMEVAAHLKDTDDEVRWAAETMLFWMGGFGAHALVASLDNFSLWERANAVELLGEMGVASWPFAGAIAARLTDVDLVREEACYALGKMGPAGGAYAPDLFARLDDEDETADVVEAAAASLRQLGF
jgi:hypothetical protein